MKIPLRDITEEKWLEMRKRGVGGSDAAAAVGQSRWKCALRLYLEKIGHITPAIQNERMLWGKKLEDVIADHYKETHGRYVRKINYMFISDKHPYMLGDPDRIIAKDFRGPGILECKNTSAYRHEDWQDDVPIEAYLQLQHYLYVTGYKWGVIAGLVGGNMYRDKEFERDEETIQMLIEKEGKFWQKVLSLEPPAADGSDDAERLLKELYPQAVDESEFMLPDEAETWLSKLAELDEQKKSVEKEMDTIKQRIKEHMKDEPKAYTPSFEVSWNNTKSGSRRFSWKARKLVEVE